MRNKNQNSGGAFVSHGDGNPGGVAAQQPVQGQGVAIAQQGPNSTVRTVQTVNRVAGSSSAMRGAAVTPHGHQKGAQVTRMGTGGAVVSRIGGGRGPGGSVTPVPNGRPSAPVPTHQIIAGQRGSGVVPVARPQGAQVGVTPVQQQQGVPMQGMPMQGVPMQGVPMQGMPMQGVPMQGVPMQGVPMQGVPMQGVPMQGVPMQGAPMPQEEAPDKSWASRQLRLQKLGTGGVAPSANHPLPVLANAEGPRANLVVIISTYRRLHILRRQLASIVAQTVKPAQIVLWANESMTPQDVEALSAYPNVSSTMNLSGWGRFMMALETPGEYVLVLDDDVGLDPAWIEKALTVMNQSMHPEENDGGTHLPPVIAIDGRLYSSDSATDYALVSAEGGTEEGVYEVDVGTRGWLMHRSFLSMLWSTPRFPGPIGWDIHMAMCAQLTGVPTLVIPGAIASDYSAEGVRVADLPGASDLKVQAYEWYRDNGWQPGCTISQDQSEAEPEQQDAVHEDGGTAGAAE